MIRNRLQKIAAKDPFKFPTNWAVANQNNPSKRTLEELSMWRDWKSSGEDPDKLQPLLDSLTPVINQQVNRHRAPRIARPAIEAHARTLAVSALRRYDPARTNSKGSGTAVSTHVFNNLKGLNRYVKKHQNFTRIVEKRSAKVGDYDRAVTILEEELGREPTSFEIADRLSMSQKQVENLQLERRKDHFSIPDPEMGAGSPFEEELPAHREVIAMLPYELTFDEKRVFDILFGKNGQKRETSTTKIANKLGWSASKVSQVKKTISKKFINYMESF